MTVPYLFDEGRITLPDGYTDRTVNIFVREPLAEGLANIQLARDTIGHDETLDAYVDRQIGLLKRKIKGLAVKSREPVVLACCKIPGIEIETHYHSNGKSVYQRQCAIVLVNRKALVFTVTNTAPFSPSQLRTWRETIDTFMPA
ncbi:MAG TPA: DUF1795 domain-containing protein [Paraburkholderia sp.]|uniref:DUF1795 domain-containing protein n=1 Tax=Paraburkholderia sp. TaxID=1926495 RepID=UPI002ED1444F